MLPLAQAAVTPLGGAAASSAVGTLSQATPGVVIVRGGARLAAEGAQNLLPGDRILVPEGGQAAVSFPGSPGNKAPLNGMLTGGRVVGHLRELIGDPTAVLLFVGYQGKGTLGAHLQEGAAQVRIDGEMHQVRCQVRSISGFSAHADESELLNWIGDFAAGKKPGDAGFPRRVFIVHGDPAAQAALAPKVRALGFEVDIPKWHDEVTLVR